MPNGSSNPAALQDHYVEGCLYLARTHLGQGDNQMAVHWANRTVAAAPWLEEAYQLLMRPTVARDNGRWLSVVIRQPS